jgi:hypothetical protein
MSNNLYRTVAKGYFVSSRVTDIPANTRVLAGVIMFTSSQSDI